MQLQEPQHLFSYVIAAFGAGGVVAGLIAFMFVKYLGSAYLSKKGENLATREDIEGLTHQIEFVKAQYLNQIEDAKGWHQLRMVAAEQRIRAHQEAFALWQSIHDSLRGGSLLRQEEQDAPHKQIVQQCHVWWASNCLYLSANVRAAFVDAYSAAEGYKSAVETFDPFSEDDKVFELWDRIAAFPDIVFAAMELPGLSESEKRDVLKPLHTILKPLK